MRKITAFCLLACLLLGLAGCSQNEAAVFVQQVSALGQMGGIAPSDRFGGIVVSESVSEIRRDEDKTVEELYVQEGDEVTEGQPLFAYDTEQLQMTLDKQRLEVEQLEASIENYTAQIAQLERDRERASSRDKLQYTIQIQTNQIDLKEAQLKLKTKQAEVKKSEYLLEHAVVFSPVTGRVTAIHEKGTDDQGNPAAYIVIQKSGSFRVKGTLNEMQRGAVMEGDRIRMESRLDPNQVWMGTVTLVDYDNPVQGNNNNFMGGSDEMGNSSRYPFYVALDSSDGLLLGQHLYLSVTAEEAADGFLFQGVALGSAFLCFEEDGSSYVWADDNGKLAKRPVTLGEYDPMNDVYDVLTGLSEEDFVAFPDEELCKPGVPTSKIPTEGGVN